MRPFPGKILIFTLVEGKNNNYNTPCFETFIHLIAFGDSMRALATPVTEARIVPVKTKNKKSSTHRMHTNDAQDEQKRERHITYGRRV